MPELTMTLLMTPDRADFAGNVRSGKLLKSLDEVAYARASRYANGEEPYKAFHESKAHW